ncbi:MAG: type II toxin-antitoxin system HicB family antitoxin [archaeon]
MGKKKMYKITAILEKEDDWFVSHCLELGIASQGKNKQEALENLREACELYIEHAEPEELAKIKINKKEPIVTTITI